MASPRIELGSGASEALILSIVLRSHKKKSATFILSPYERCSAGRALYYEAIKKTNQQLLYYPRPKGVQPGGHFTTKPILSFKDKKWVLIYLNHTVLFSKIYNVGSKYFYCNCKQNNTKKFSYYQQTIRTQCTLYPF